MAPIQENIIPNDRGLEKRRSFLKYPGESSEVDYKDSILLKSDDPTTIKLIKHILGMSNMGGGFIVIGYMENANKHPEPVILDESVIASYDLSSLASQVERYTHGTDKIDLVIHKDAHPDTGNIYPIIEIKGFKKRPFFCKSTARGILEDGALYIRIASARTVKTASPEEWEQLIDICVERRQEEVLHRFTSLIKEIGFPNLSSENNMVMDKQREDWFSKNRKEVAEINKSHNNHNEGLEFEHWLIKTDARYNQKQLLDIAEKSERRNTGWPIGIVVVAPEHKPIPVIDGIKCKIDSLGGFGGFGGLDYWGINDKADYYFFRRFEEEREIDNPNGERVMYFDTRIWRVAELVDHTIAFYKELSVDPKSKIMLVVRHVGLRGRKLVANNRSRNIHPRFASAEQAEWTKEMSLDFLHAERSEIIATICRNLFVLFEFWEPPNSVVEAIINEYDKSYM